MSPSVREASVSQSETLSGMKVRQLTPRAFL